MSILSRFDERLLISFLILILWAGAGIYAVNGMSKKQQPFYVHAHHYNDTITVRFSSQTVYVLDYHPIAMQGSLRYVGTINATNETRRYTQYNTTVGDFTLYYDDTTPTVLSFRQTCENHTMHYKILP